MIMKPKHYIDAQYEMHRLAGNTYSILRVVGILLGKKDISLLKSDQVRQFAMRQIKASTLPKGEHVAHHQSKESV